jgi:hypothetical protein
MDKQHNGIFRKYALEQVKSPENLSDYIRVTTPAAWLLIAAAVAILAGFAIWGFFGSVEVIDAAGIAQQVRPIDFLLGTMGG